MSKSSRKLFAKGLIDLANLVAAALIFGQFVSDRKIDLNTILLGVTITIIFYLWALEVLKEK